jgi:hypothetical protein
MGEVLCIVECIAISQLSVHQKPVLFFVLLLDFSALWYLIFPLLRAALCTRPDQGGQDSSIVWLLCLHFSKTSAAVPGIISKQSLMFVELTSD